MSGKSGKAPPFEGDIITYTLSYANTSLITQNITVTDILPFNLTLMPETVTPTLTEREGSKLVWRFEKGPGESGEISFQARVSLLPSLHQEGVGAACPPEEYPPAYVLPVSIACDTTRFWANGVTRQPPVHNPHTIEVQIPPDANPSTMWLAVKGVDDLSLEVDGSQASPVATSHNEFGASLWSAPVTTQAIASGEVMVRTDAPRRLNAIFLYEDDDPPFDAAALDDFYNTPRLFTYTLEMPSVKTETIDVLIPFMDITYLTDDLLPDTRMTTVTVQYADQPSQTVRVTDPNLGNGLLMTQFSFATGYISPSVASKVLTVAVDTEDSVYTLGPRVCRPLYIENTAWLCSEQGGCISDTVINEPENFLPYPPGDGIYLPIIYKP